MSKKHLSMIELFVSIPNQFVHIEYTGRTKIHCVGSPSRALREYGFTAYGFYKRGDKFPVLIQDAEKRPDLFKVIATDEPLSLEEINSKVNATDGAKKLANTKGIDLRNVKGKRERISVTDVRNALKE